jgi:HTH-type transcriptional regulator/antitoxin HigA
MTKSTRRRSDRRSPSLRPHILKNEGDYNSALAHLEALMTARRGTKQGDELELWACLVEQYEREHYPIDPPDPIEAIRFRMEQEGWEPKDLVRFIGSRSRVSEVLARKRPLSLKMIRALHEGMGIPAEVLIRAGAA